MASESPITVGAAAHRAGISAKAVRLYEAHGLLEPAQRTESGYRTFVDRDVEVLKFIRQAKALGLSLKDIKDIIDLQRHGTQPCGKVLQLLDARIGQIDQTIADLKALRRTLARAQAGAKASSDQGASATVCRIIESYLAETPSSASVMRESADRECEPRAGA